VRKSSRAWYETFMPKTWDPFSLDPDAALHRLQEGNRRFLAGTSTQARGFDAQMMSAPQKPFAIVLGCSDSRTPVEILFDQGFGDLFVVRIAGNIVAPSGVGSIEFAASAFGTRLVVVMGHTGCGGITATVNAIASGQGPESKNLRSITDRIAPHIEAIARRGSGPETMREAMRANVRASVDHLRHGSAVLEELVMKERLRVVGSEYELETGRVNFFDY
jgi:carbonic anhydrase